MKRRFDPLTRDNVDGYMQDRAEGPVDDPLALLGPFAPFSAAVTWFTGSGASSRRSFW